MDLDIWMEIYEEIISDLSLSLEDDIRASREFSDLLAQNTRIDLNIQVLRELKGQIGGKECLIFGTSMDLEKTLMLAFNEMEEWVKDGGKILIAADGAASILLSLEIVPDIIVSDLDGGIEDQLTCGRMGSILLIHAHGDNKKVIRTTVPKLKGKVLGTTQVRMEPSSGLFNFGGFTDGDRAVMMADELGASSITLIGFDLEVPGTKVLDGGRRKGLDHSGFERKKKKLEWANRIIEMANCDVRFF